MRIIIVHYNILNTFESTYEHTDIYLYLFIVRQNEQGFRLLHARQIACMREVHNAGERSPVNRNALDIGLSFKLLQVPN